MASRNALKTDKQTCSKTSCDKSATSNASIKLSVVTKRIPRSQFRHSRNSTSEKVKTQPKTKALSTSTSKKSSSPKSNGLILDRRSAKSSRKSTHSRKLSATPLWTNHVLSKKNSSSSSSAMNPRHHSTGTTSLTTPKSTGHTTKLTTSQRNSSTKASTRKLLTTGRSSSIYRKPLSTK